MELEKFATEDLVELKDSLFNKICQMKASPEEVKIFGEIELILHRRGTLTYVDFEDVRH